MNAYPALPAGNQLARALGLLADSEVRAQQPHSPQSVFHQHIYNSGDNRNGGSVQYASLAPCYTKPAPSAAEVHPKTPDEMAEHLHAFVDGHPPIKNNPHALGMWGRFITQTIRFCATAGMEATNKYLQYCLDAWREDPKAFEPEKGKPVCDFAYLNWIKEAEAKQAASTTRGRRPGKSPTKGGRGRRYSPYAGSGDKFCKNHPDSGTHSTSECKTGRQQKQKQADKKQTAAAAPSA